MDITKLSETELKALAYDQLAQIEAAQNNLRIINEEIAKRARTEKPEDEPDKDPKKK